MKIHRNEIFKRNSQFILFIGTSLVSLISVAVNLSVLAKIKEPIIIGIDLNGTRVVTNQNDPIYKTEATAYIQKFIFNVYNFNSKNFHQRIGLATGLMSEELWLSKKNIILDLKDKVERDAIAVEGAVQKISQDVDGVYYVRVDVREASRLKVSDHKIDLKIKLKSVARDISNPYGLEVDLYEETIRSL